MGILQANKWIDIATRAIAVEMNIYNVNIGMFAVLQMVSLFHGGGGVEPFVHVRCLALFMLLLRCAISYFLYCVAVSLSYFPQQ